MELNRTELRVVSDYLARELETLTDWYNNGLDPEFDFGKELLEVNHVLDHVEQEIGGPVWTSELYIEGRRLYKEGIKLPKPVVLGINEMEVDNRDSSTTWLWWMGFYIELEREFLELLLKTESTLEDTGVAVVTLPLKVVLYKEDVEYLIENMDENNE